MKKVTNEQKREALEIVEYISQSFLNEEGIVDVKFEDALNDYRKDDSRVNYIKVLVSLCLSDIFMPYRLEKVNGEEIWVADVEKYKGKNGQYISTGLDKISKGEAVKYSWYIKSGYEFFGEKSRWNNKDFLIVNHEKDYFAFPANHIKKVRDFVYCCDKVTCDYEDEDVILFAEIIADKKIWKENKKYLNKITNVKYNGFIHIVYDEFNFYSETYFIVDKEKGMIQLTKEEYNELEEIA